MTFRKLRVSAASESKEVKACFDAFAAEAANITVASGNRIK